MHVDHRAVARRDDASSATGPTWRSRAAPGSFGLRLRDLTCAWAVAICALTCATVARSPLTRPPSLSRTCCSAARAAAICAVSSLTFVCDCSRSKRLPAPAATSSVFCATRFRARSSEAVERRRLAGRLVQLLVQLRLARLRVGQLRLRPRAAAARSAPTFASSDCELRLERLDFVLVGRRVDLESTSPFLTGRLFSTGTSITRPLTCDTIGTTYFTTRTSARRRREDVEQQEQRGDARPPGRWPRPPSKGWSTAATSA